MSDKSETTTQHSSLLSYAAGFILSILLTLTAYVIATDKLFSGSTIVYVIAGLAVTQLIVQVIFFLHLGEEKKPRLNLMTFTFMLMIIFILVIGSIWIMNNLHYNMMSNDAEQYMLDQYNKGGF